MAFTDNIKEITPSLSSIKTGTPGYKIGDKFFVGGIGGNSIPANGSTVKAGYVTYENGVMTFHNVTDNNTSTVDKLYVANTGVSEPEYEGSSSSSSTNFYKCASVNTSTSTWTGYKAVQNSTTKVWSFESTLTTDSLTFDSNKNVPVVGKSYSADATIEASLYKGIDENTIFLLNVDTLTDKTGNFTVAKDNESAVFSTEEGLFSKNRLVLPDHGMLQMTSANGTTIGGDTDYTVELWYTNRNSSNSTCYFPIFSPPSTLEKQFQLHPGEYNYYMSIWQQDYDTTRLSSTELTVGSTHHLVYSRRASDGLWKAWLDGQMVYDWGINGSTNTEMSYFEIGNGYTSSRYNAARIQDYRISNCLRYTTDTFTTPTEPLN